MVLLTKKIVNPIGRWVLITGCDSGFGFLSTISLLDQGFGVISACLTEQGRDNLKEASGNNSRLHSIQCDVTNSKQVEDLIDTTKKITDNELWALVNNAGVACPCRIDFLNLDDFRRVFEVNFFAAVNLTQHCIPMLKNSRGRIVNISSTCGFFAMAGNSPYNASKFAIEGFSDTIRRDLHVWGINISIIQPGNMCTAISKNYYRTMEQIFENSPESIQKQYGIENLKKYCEEREKILHKISQDPQLVITDILHAIKSKRPKIRYRPGTWAKYIFPFMNSLRNRRSDMILRLIDEIPPSLLLKNRGQFTLELYEKFPGTPEEVWDAWLEYLWIQGADIIVPRIESKGDIHGAGCNRLMPFYKNWGIREGITDADYPRKLFYKVLNPSAFTFPVRAHNGMVRFIPDENGNTIIKWVINFTPMFMSRLFVVAFTKVMIKKILTNLKVHLENISKSSSL